MPLATLRETEHAERVLRALRNWAEDAFNVLFSHDHGAALFARATAGGEESAGGNASRARAEVPSI